MCGLYTQTVWRCSTKIRGNWPNPCVNVPLAVPTHEVGWGITRRACRPPRGSIGTRWLVWLERGCLTGADRPTGSSALPNPNAAGRLTPENGIVPGAVGLLMRGIVTPRGGHSKSSISLLTCKDCFFCLVETIVSCCTLEK